jgi:alpha-amylase
MSRRRRLSLLSTSVLAALLVTPAPWAAAARYDSAGAQHSLRAPVTDENFYFVMADRFENGSTANDLGGLPNERLVSGFDPTKSNFYNGGDLIGLRQQLDYIQGLGTTALWLTPSFKNKPVQLEDGPSAGYHGYWITDYTQIDPHLGTNEDLRALIDDAHGRGMKVFFDIVLNHTADVISYAEGARMPYISKDTEPYRTADGTPFDDQDYAGDPDFPALNAETSFPYAPVLAPGEENLKVPAWLNDVTLYHNRGDTTFAGEDSLYGDFFGLDDLFTEHPTVINGFTEVFQNWVTEFGIDGYRIDTMKHVNDQMWQQFGPAVLEHARQQGKDEFFMFGEVFDSGRPFTSTFTARNKMQAVLDFPFQDAARKFVSQGQSAADLGRFFVDDDWYTDADSNVYQLPTFLGNHDIGRFGAILQTDNPGAAEADLLARSELAHELMYFSRGNPVIYYGDEQGFAGQLGFEGSRQSMFPSQVPEYLDDNLLGTDSTHAQSNFNSSHTLYRGISQLAALTRDHPALRDGAQQHRYAADGAGIYAFSRIDVAKQKEYIVALNNSGTAQTATFPTFNPKGDFKLLYGQGARKLRGAGSDGSITVTVPPLSTVVYEATGKIAKSKAAPSVTLGSLAPSPAARSRMELTASVSGASFYEVTFQARVDGGEWTSIGTDDNFPYRVFHDVSSLTPGTPLSYRAVVLDNKGHTSTSPTQTSAVPAPTITITSPAADGTVRGIVAVRAETDPERASQSVTFQRRIAGGEWTDIGTDSSSPAYTVRDDVGSLGLAVGTVIDYRAILEEPDQEPVVSAVRTVTVAAAFDNDDDQTVLPPASVSVPGDLNTEFGCTEDWVPACAAAQMTLDSNDGIFKLTADLPAGTYNFKVAHNGSWDVNYGAKGELNGANITFTAPGGPVTFYYDHRTHWITNNVLDPIVTAPGSHQSELGCRGDWDPSCMRPWLQDKDGDGTYVWTTTRLAPGNYAAKVTHGLSWAENYGADGAPGGGDINFIVASAGASTTFQYNVTTHVLTISSG